MKILIISHGRSGSTMLLYALSDVLNLEKIATNDDKLFMEFNQLKPKKIILKRPLKSEIIYNTPNYQVKGKSTRFDIYI